MVLVLVLILVLVLVVALWSWVLLSWQVSLEILDEENKQTKKKPLVKFLSGKILFFV